ncbi:MAG: aminodeoxychorismate synthase component I [Candidatus Latescibacteria bacterium]|nr:aminodeoxychorismate synthase component I [Candidatus Latescibacterota bacterium]
MKTLLLDNYDSFTYNLFHLIAAVRGDEPLVISNDQTALEEIRTLPIDSVVISPGPGRPERTRDFGVCQRVLLELDLPQLGVCLGHQGLAHTFGASIRSAPEPVHGQASAIVHDHPPLFAGIPQGFAAVRYHSLVVATPLPDCLAPIAWTRDGLLMGLHHRQRPLWGIQFHPESVCSEYGETLMGNFLSHIILIPRVQVPDLPWRRPESPRPSPPETPQLHCRRLDHCPDPETVFGRIFAQAPYAYWLDSSAAHGDARFSYMGAATTVLHYRAPGQDLRIRRGTQLEKRRQGLFDFLREHPPLPPPPDLPFSFTGGWVGYLGYEFKSECLGIPSPASPHPDAVLLKAERFLVFDHQQQQLFLVALGPAEEAASWFAQLQAQLRDLQALPPVQPATPGAGFPFHLRRSRAGYLRDIEQCLQAIREGESYELCLTNQVLGPAVADPLSGYRTLRRLNPAPYAAFLRLGDFSLLSSSPEQFLRIDASGRVSTRPIKGTRARGATPQADLELRHSLATAVKDRAENLMITDLLRHDLGRVCRTGSIQVPSLMEVETFASCHQLVSTVCGQLHPDLDAFDCIRAAFPGGSMTGAPKLRSLELLDQLEAGPRGPYSGALGFIGFDGRAELSIVIRTAVCSATGTAIGAGGAIVAHSDPEAEFAELLLKANPVVQALTLAQTGERVVSPAQIE